jgi:A/G-specific adenine glycosylase
MKSSNKVPDFTKLLMEWHEHTNKRNMPWKGEKDPYKIWLSEIILQQTRVDQGLAYYLKFVRKFPGIQQLAAAKDDTVFKLWEGLGYYTRCKNLIATARHITKELNGKFPDSYEAILELKGVGPYTASAIASFAFDLPYAVLDGNVSRVLARYFGIHTPIDSGTGKFEFAALAKKLLHKNLPGLYNQAIMDFGATICKPQVPLCNQCVFALNCKAFNENMIDVLPVKEKKIIRKNRWFYYLLIEHKSKFYVRKRITKDIWQSLHEFVLVEKTGRKDPLQVLTSGFKDILPPDYMLEEISDFYKQLLTHQTIHACFVHVRITDPLLTDGYTLMDKKALGLLAFPRLLNDYLIYKGLKKNNLVLI